MDRVVSGTLYVDFDCSLDVFYVAATKKMMKKRTIQIDFWVVLFLALQYLVLI
jgi:hypothetical protein